MIMRIVRSAPETRPGKKPAIMAKAGKALHCVVEDAWLGATAEAPVAVLVGLLELVVVVVVSVAVAVGAALEVVEALEFWPFIIQLLF